MADLKYYNSTTQQWESLTNTEQLEQAIGTTVDPSGTTTAGSVMGKLDLFLAFDRLTTKEYETLMSMLNAEV